MKLKRIIWFLFIAAILVSSTALTVAFAKREVSVFGKTLDLSWISKEGEEEITILMTGDIMLGRYIATLNERNGDPFPFTYMPLVIKDIKEGLDTDELDIVAGNLECPITNYTSNSGKLISFHCEPKVADLLAQEGFTTLNTANNHLFDQGRQGHSMTRDYLQAAGIDAFGHPDTPNGDWSYKVYEIGNKRIAFLGLNDTDFNLNEDAAVEKIKAIDPYLDFLIVSIHWGFEYEPIARESVQNLAHKLVDAGADMIWGHHPHVIQNSELYNGAPIYYSLGNFTFDQYWSQETQEGLVVGLKIAGDKITTTELVVDLINQGEPKPRISEN